MGITVTPGRKTQVAADPTDFWKVSKNKFLELNKYGSKLYMFFSKQEMGWSFLDT